MSFILPITMSFYATKHPDGLWHVDNFIQGLHGQHHLHSDRSFEAWKKHVHKRDLHLTESDKPCSCCMTKSGDVKEYDDRQWHNDMFEKADHIEALYEAMKDRRPLF